MWVVFVLVSTPCAKALEAIQHLFLNLVELNRMHVIFGSFWYLSCGRVEVETLLEDRVRAINLDLAVLLQQ